MSIKTIIIAMFRFVFLTYKKRSAKNVSLLTANFLLYKFDPIV